MNHRTISVAAALVVLAADFIGPEAKHAGKDWSCPAGAEPVDGPAAKAGRNAPCPCGSGKKHKRCCRQRHVGKWPTSFVEEEAKLLEKES